MEQRANLPLQCPRRQIFPDLHFNTVLFSFKAVPPFVDEPDQLITFPASNVLKLTGPKYPHFRHW
jgi:hypothetical protein